MRRAASEPQGEDLYFLFGIDAGLLDHQPRGHIRSRAEAADAEGFPFELFERFEFRLSDQRHRPVVEIAGDDADGQSSHRAADHRAEKLAIVHVAR